jgi:hypothetical protein
MDSFLWSEIYEAEGKNVSDGWVMFFGFLHCQRPLTNKHDPNHNPNLIHSSYFPPRMKQSKIVSSTVDTTDESLDETKFHLSAIRLVPPASIFIMVRHVNPYYSNIIYMPGLFFVYIHIFGIHSFYSVFLVGYQYLVPVPY